MKDKLCIQLSYRLWFPFIPLQCWKSPVGFGSVGSCPVPNLLCLSEPKVLCSLQRNCNETHWFPVLSSPSCGDSAIDRPGDIYGQITSPLGSVHLGIGPSKLSPSIPQVLCEGLYSRFAPFLQEGASGSVSASKNHFPCSAHCYKEISLSIHWSVLMVA